MKRLFTLCLAVCMLLSGCASLMDGSYISTTPHREQNDPADIDTVQVSDYQGLQQALGSMAQAGIANSIIFVPNYDQNMIEADMKSAVSTVLREDPIAAYAVEDISWELGTNSGQSAIAVDIRYIHDRQEIRKIRNVDNMDEAKGVIFAELKNCAASVVLYMQNYKDTDFLQLVEDYVFNNPQSVMERPEVAVNVYPRWGSHRVVELKFTYQTSRESLRSMQSEVSLVFTSAVLYVSGSAEDREKFSQLYSFLMERFEYQIETSITPAYSLLRHGVGDAKAFATVYAAMCREAGLDCQVVSGTRMGEPWYWNQINDDGAYYHVDLLHSNELGVFQELTDGQMEGYVWDYSAYPESPDEVQPEGTQPEETQAVETQGE